VQLKVFLETKGKNLRVRTTCLTKTLLERSGTPPPENIALNVRVRKLLKSLRAPEVH
jgi:hypothetical protein